MKPLSKNPPAPLLVMERTSLAPSLSSPAKNGIAKVFVFINAETGLPNGILGWVACVHGLMLGIR